MGKLIVVLARFLPICVVVLAISANAAAQPTPLQVSVPANQAWIDTGIDLALGSSVTITASGTIRIAGSDPGKTPAGAPECPAPSDFVAPGLPCWSLIGRIGNGAPFYVGTAKGFSVTISGRLFLGVNDNFFPDNSGSWAATVTVTRNQPPTAGFTMSVGDGVVSATDRDILDFTLGEGFTSKIRVFLSTQGSSDPDGDSLTYEWRVNDVLVDLARDFMNRDYIDLTQETQSLSLTVKDDRREQASAVGTVIITPRSGATQLPLSWPFISPEEGAGAWHIDPGSSRHRGDDFYAQDWNWKGGDLGRQDRGKVLLSPANGEVIFTRTDPKDGYGREVIIRLSRPELHDFAVRFAHMEEVWVANGPVCAGTPVGTIGFSGQGATAAAHLHAAVYMGVFQLSAQGNGQLTGYEWLNGDGEDLERISGDPTRTRFATDLNFKNGDRPQGCATYALEGRVVRPKGKGIEGIDGVTVTLTNLQDNSQKTFPSTYGDSSGHYAFNGLTPGQYSIRVSKQDCKFKLDKDKTDTVTRAVTNAHVEAPIFTGTGPGCN